MDISDFVTNFSGLFEETDPGNINGQTRFREELDEWDSLMALSVIAMVDSEYGVTLTAGDIRDSTTVEDLFKAVRKKK